MNKARNIPSKQEPEPVKLVEDLEKEENQLQNTQSPIKRSNLKKK